MSDDDNANGNSKNQGITLPDQANATYNIALSPLFLNRSARGSGNVPEYAIMERGRYGFMWSNNTSADGGAYYLSFHQGVVWPSNFLVRYTPRSLRCLVSTTNS